MLELILPAMPGCGEDTGSVGVDGLSQQATFL